MSRSRLVPVISITLTITFALAAKSFRASGSRVGTFLISSAGSLTPAAPMLEPRSGHSATLLPNGKVLVAGGMRRNQDFYKSAELYDPATGKFQPTGEMSLGRVGHIAVLLHSGKVLIAGGWVNLGATDSAELYDPASGKFTAIGKMTTRRGCPSATLLANGDVLIAGGEDHDGPGAQLASAEIFRAATLQFAPTGSMHRARIRHTATLLRDGRVLLAGGFAAEVTASAEIYDSKNGDPKKGSFTETGSMSTERCKHTAGLLPDGRVLIAGGSDSRGWNSNLSSAEIYDTRTGKFTATLPMNDSRFKLPDDSGAVAFGKTTHRRGQQGSRSLRPGQRKIRRGLRRDERQLALPVGNQIARRQGAAGRRIPEQRPSHDADLDLPALALLTPCSGWRL